MVIISSEQITEDQRRANIRELANISPLKFSDDELDLKIENWDAVTKSYFNVEGQELTGVETFFRNFITVSNLLTSIAILNGIGGSDNLARLKEQTALYRSIINAQNQKEPEQSTNKIIQTFGINNKSGTFG